MIWYTLGQTRQRISRFWGIFFEDIATSEIFGIMVLIGDLLQKFRGGGGGWVCRRQCVSMMTRGISFFKLNGNFDFKRNFPHIVMKTNWGAFLTFHDHVDQTVWELNCQSDLFLLKLIETISSWQVIHQH